MSLETLKPELKGRVVLALPSGVHEVEDVGTVQRALLEAVQLHISGLPFTLWNGTTSTW